MGHNSTASRETVAVTVITTVLDKGTGALELLDSVLGGTVAPAELIVSDGGSTDGTVDLLTEYARSHPMVKVITDAGGRSAGRNAAIAAASHELIVCIDGGCVATSEWLEEITAPLIEGEDWVAGFYQPVGNNDLSTAIGLTMVFVLDEVVFPDFTPSARSMALRRSLWEEVGGFPEDVSPPSGLLPQARTLFSWGRGDGHLGLRSINYRHLFPRFAAAGVIFLLGLIEPLLLPLAPLPLAPMVHRKSRSKYQHMSGWSKRLLIPLATLNGLAFSLAGYVTGYAERRTGRWEVPALSPPSPDVS